MIRFIIGTLASLGVLVGAIVLERGNLLAYLVPSALGIALLMPFFGVLAVWSLADWVQAWRDALGKGKVQGGDKGARKSAAIWAFSEKTSYAAGVVGFITGLIIMLSNLSTPETLGPSVAAGLTCPLYAVLEGLVCRILRARVESRLEGSAS
mgnify:FL=1